MSECGTRSAYVRGCRCQPCRTANTTYQRERERQNPEAAARHAEKRREWARSEAGRESRRSPVQRESRRRWDHANRDKLTARHLDLMRRRQAETAPHARNAHLPWTPEDDRVVVAFPAAEAARRLGRTYYAVVQRRQKVRRG